MEQEMVLMARAPAPKPVVISKFAVESVQSVVFKTRSYGLGHTYQESHVLTVEEAEEFARQLREAAAKVRQGA